MKPMHSRLILLSVLAISLLSTMHASATTVGTFGAPRVTTANPLTGTVTPELGATFASHFPDANVVTSPTLTPDFLSGVDCLVIATAKAFDVSITPLSAQEQTALYDFVLDGGNALLITEGLANLYLPAAQSIASVFGVSVVDDGLAGIQPALPVAPLHPIVSGPFGVQNYLAVYGSGAFVDLGPYASPLFSLTATSLPVALVIEADAIAPGSGRVIMVADTHLYLGDAIGGFFSTHEPFILNSYDYLLAPVPEPSSVCLAGMAMAGLLCAGGRRGRAARLIG